MESRFTNEPAMAKARDIFWKHFQGTGMSRDVFNVLFDSAIEEFISVSFVAPGDLQRIIKEEKKQVVGV